MSLSSMKFNKFNNNTHSKEQKAKTKINIGRFITKLPRCIRTNSWVFFFFKRSFTMQHTGFVDCYYNNLLLFTHNKIHIYILPI